MKRVSAGFCGDRWCHLDTVRWTFYKNNNKVNLTLCVCTKAHLLYLSPSSFWVFLMMGVHPSIPSFIAEQQPWRPLSSRPTGGAGGWRWQRSLRTCCARLCCLAGAPCSSCWRGKASTPTCAQVKPAALHLTTTTFIRHLVSSKLDSHLCIFSALDKMKPHHM